MQQKDGTSAAGSKSDGTGDTKDFISYMRYRQIHILDTLGNIMFTKYILQTTGVDLLKIRLHGFETEDQGVMQDINISIKIS